MAESSAVPFYSYGPAYELEALNFKSATDLMFWAEELEKAWVHIFEIEDVKVHAAIRPAFAHNRTIVRNVIAAAKNYAANPSEEQKRPLDQNMKAFAKRRIPLTSPGFPDYFADLQNRFSLNVAASALGGFGDFLSNPMDVTDQDVRLGLLASSVFRLQPNADQAAAIAKNVSDLGKKYESALSELNSKAKQFDVDAASQLAKDDLAAKDRRTSDRQEADFRLAIFEQDGNTAIESIKRTEATYLKQMQLQASVNYWGARATNQQTSGWIFLGCLGVFLGASFCAGKYLADNYLPILLQVPLDQQPARYGVALTITLLLTTIFFWVARVLVRLYLSAHHLSNDARERVVMVETFLALLNEGKLEDKDKALVLTPLFRPSADGIVKDEGAPDTSAASLLARLLEKR